MVRRPVPRIERARCAVLYPAVAQAARRTGGSAVGLIDLGTPAGLATHLDRLDIRCGTMILGDTTSHVQVATSTVGTVGTARVPVRPVPEVVARIRVDTDPLDVRDEGDRHRLQAGVPPDRPDLRSALDDEIAVLADDPADLLRGDPVALVCEAVARVPAAALPVVITTWALSRLSPPRRRRFVAHLDDAAGDRPVAWVSLEGVGVAPTVPTLGDRPASGHSIIGLVVAGPSGRTAEALGRCWSRGRLMSWFTDPVG